MNEDFNSIIDQYRADGRDDGYIARKIFLSKDYNGEFNDLVNMVSSYKKKEEEAVESPSPQEFVPITSDVVLGGTPSGSSSPEPKDKEPVADQLNKFSTIDEIGSEFQKRFFDDKTLTMQELVSDDADFGAKVQEIASSDKTEQEKRYAVELEFRNRYSKRERDIREQYTDEIISRLPEDTDLEQASNLLYSKYGLGIPLDGDRRYNEGIGGITNSVTDATIDLGVSLAGIGTSVASLSTSPFVGMDLATTIKNSAQKEIDEFQQSTTTQYDQTFFEALKNGDIGEVITRSVRGVATSAPYFVPAILSGGSTVVAGAGIGAMAGADSYMRSRSEDLDRLRKGIDPIYGDSASGELARFGAASIDAILTGVAGKIQGDIAKRALGQVIRNPKTVQTATQIFKGHLKEQGIDIGTEGGVEVIQEVANMAYQDVIAGQDFTGAQYIERGVEAFLLGSFSSAAIAAPGAGYSGLRAGRELITGPQAAARSRVEKAGKKDVVENLNATQDISGPVSNFESDRRFDLTQKEAFYTMMSVRHPVDMDRIKNLDLSMERAVFEYRKVKKEEGDLEAITGRIQSIVEQRQAITESYSGESVNLTPQETRSVEDSKISNALDNLNDNAEVLSESVDAQEDYLGTEGFDQGAYEEAVQDRELAVSKKKEALRLVGELGKARKNTEEATREASNQLADVAGVEEAAAKEYEAEQNLRLHLGLNLNPIPEVVDAKQKPSDPNVLTKESIVEATPSQYVEAMEKGRTRDEELGTQLFKQVDPISVEQAQEIVDNGGKLYITKDGHSGSYLKSNGYMGGLFKSPDSKMKRVSKVMQEVRAEDGGTYFDAYATELENIYVKNGYKPVARLPFNEEFARSGWDDEGSPLKGKPDVVFFTKGAGEAGGGKMFNDYDQAEKFSIDQVKSDITPGPTVDPLSEPEAEPEVSDTRGLEGQFTSYKPQKDGSLGVMAKGPLKAKTSRFINKNLAPTFRSVYGDGFEVFVHNTGASIDAASTNSNPVTAFARINKDGTAAIHISSERLSEVEAAGLDPRAILVEETIHAVASKSFSKLYKSDPNSFRKMVGEMTSIARATKNADFVSEIEAQLQAYEADGEAVVLDEAMAKMISQLIDYDNPKLIDRFRVLINRIIRAASGKDSIQLKTLDAKKLKDAFTEMALRGTEVKIEDTAVEETVERSAISPSKLPENQEFEMTWWEPRVYRGGALVGLTGESSIKSRTFNGKWHFINWWKSATKMGRLNFTGFKAEIDGKEVEVNASIMSKWNMKPPVDRVKANRQAEEQKQRGLVSLASFVNKQRLAKEEREGVSFYMNQYNIGHSYKIMFDEASTFMTEEQMDRSNEILSESEGDGPLSNTDQYSRIFKEVLTPQDVSKLVEAMETTYETESDIDPIERSAVSSMFNFLDNPAATGDFEIRSNQKRDAICSLGGRTCSTNDKVSLLQYESYMIKQKIGDNPSAKESVDIAASSLGVALNHFKNLGFDVNGVVDNYNEGKEVFFNSIDINPDIKINPRDFSGVYDLILSYTSNGSQLDPNILIANQLFSSGLFRVQTGASEFISKDRIEAIRKKEIDGTLSSVNGQRAGAMSDHLSDINNVINEYLKDGKFDVDRFFKDMKKRDRNGVPALAKKIGKNTEKLADLVLGNMGDPKAIPMDSNFKDQYNIYRGKFDLTDYSEGLVIPQETRLSVISRMKAAGRNVDESMSDPELFSDIREMKSSGDDATIGLGKKFYAELTGNNLADLRDFSVQDKKAARGFTEAVAKKMGITPFQAQQLMYMDGIYTWNLYREGESFISDYKSAQQRNLAYDNSPMAIDRASIFAPGQQIEMFSQEVPPEATRFQTPGRRVVSGQMKNGDATSNELYRERSLEVGSKVRVRGTEALLTQESVDNALETDATSRRIIGKGVDISEGQKVGVRLNLNVMKNTGVPVQTMHDKSASGEALKYAPAVTVKNATLFVNQNARNKIVTFQENKFPMASVNGEFVSSGIDLDYSGVKAVFNPFRHNVFVDMAGRPIKSAEEATVIGGTVYLRGNIEYYDMSDPVVSSGRTETDEQRSKRIKRGPKYDKAIKRFIGYSKSQGIEYANTREAEAAYDNMNIPSEVAINDSEVAGNMAEAMERASISNFTKKGMKMRQTASKASRKFTEARADIINNPSNYIVPQKLSEIKNRIQDFTDQELVDAMTDEAVGRLSQRNDDMGVLAGSEMISRAVARGETERIPAIIAELASIGTTAGRILRHFRELKSSTPAGLSATIKSSVEASGNTLSEKAESELNQMTADLFEKQAIVDDLMRRAVGGEEVDVELKSAIDKLKSAERLMDTFSNKYIEKGWGDLFGQLVQGNLLTTMSQALNVAANMVNAVGNVAVGSVSLPIEAAYVKVGNALGKNLEMRRRPSLSAYMYATRKFGQGFIESADQFVTGQNKDISEWRVNRGLAPVRSFMAAWNKDLPLGPDGKVSISQRSKLFAQGTLGVPAETMFRMLSFGDVPFRRYAEGLYLYQTGLSMGLEGEALARFLKYPTKDQLVKAQVEGRKLTFQEDTIASKTVNQVVTTMENVTGDALDNIPGLNGKAFAKGFYRAMLPFRSTPANILLETFTWVNPYVGITRMASDISKGNPEDASKTMAKMMLGAVTMEAAMLMIKEGVISGAIQWNEDEEKNIAYDVFPPSSINVSALQRLIDGKDPSKQEDDRFVKYDKLGMIGAILGTAIQSVDMSDTADVKSEGYDGPIDFFTDALTNFFGLKSFAAISTMMEQSFVQGLNGFLKVLTGDDVERNMENLVISLFQAGSASVLPNQMSAFYRAEREFLPDTRTTKDMSATERILKKFEYTIKDRTFGLSEAPIRRNWKGEPIAQTPRGTSSIAYQLFDISKSRQGTSDPLSNEIWRLYEQTEDLTSICGTPTYAAKRSLPVPDIKSKKERRAAKRLGREYTWMQDEEFMRERVYLSVDQMNRLMETAGKERYKEASMLIEGSKYQNASDEKKIEMLNEVAENYASAKEYDGSRFKNHSALLFDILQEIHDGR